MLRVDDLRSPRDLRFFRGTRTPNFQKQPSRPRVVAALSMPIPTQKGTSNPKRTPPIYRHSHPVAMVISACTRKEPQTQAGPPIYSNSLMAEALDLNSVRDEPRRGLRAHQRRFAGRHLALRARLDWPQFLYELQLLILWIVSPYKGCA